MEPLLWLLLATVIVLICWCVKQLSENRAGLPPGPMGLPLLGYYPFLWPSPHLALHKLKKKYGGVFGMFLGRQYCVVLGSLESFKEAYSKDEFQDRPPRTAYKISDKTSFVDLSGKEWVDQRRFSLRALRSLGFGKTQLEEQIQDEIEVMFEEFDRQEVTSHPQLFHQLLSIATTNIMFHLLYGHHLSYKDTRRHFMDDYLTHIGPFLRQLSLHAIFPWTRKMLMTLSLLKYDVAKVYISHVEEFNRQEIEDHEHTINPDNIRDYIDCFLLESQKRGSHSGLFNKMTLNGNLTMMMRAGILTTRAVVEWTLLALALRPQVQEKVHAEISQIIGKSKPCWSHSRSMPYTNAVLLEAQRWRTIVPVNTLRHTSRETSVKGFRIPAGTVIISNLWSIHNDSVQWTDPEEFRPERMLSPEGKALPKTTEEFVGFSTGRRDCPGQVMAHMEIFLLFTSILQKYHISIPEGHTPDLEGQIGSIWQTKDLKLTLTQHSV